MDERVEVPLSKAPGREQLKAVNVQIGVFGLYNIRKH